MVTIIFESHGTSLDNETHRSSGWYDVELSELGTRQAAELGERYKDETFDAIFCSDLKRSYATCEIAFRSRGIPIMQDRRLRECNYGDFTRHPSEEVEKEKANRISKPFPNGESYEETAQRMKSFLSDLLKNYDGKRVMIIGHRATQYGLEHWIKEVALFNAVTAPWQWQPGWEYQLVTLSP
ncbi:MAG: histidine phosphatase family protein [Parcubacteria group bacterium]|nr:histidine phosphatase family protein [Parcubacteria group bacterium]